MPTMDECRRKAEECLRWADETANDRQRETLLEIARLWTQMELSSAEPNGRGPRLNRFAVRALPITSRVRKMGPSSAQKSRISGATATRLDNGGQGKTG